MTKILWLDNDRTFLLPFVALLHNELFDVIRVYNVLEAEKLLQDGTKWKLIIIDCMLSIGEDEELKYPPSVTDSGHVAGLIFFKRNKEFIRKIEAEACVFSIREDKTIINRFIEEGLKKENYLSKVDGADAIVFLKWVKNILGDLY
jgi:hypothetical protein